MKQAKIWSSEINMRTKGKITFWNDEKGYGFITPSAGSKQVFVHIRAFRNYSQRPEINQFVTFSQSTDKQGRPCAVRVALAGDKIPKEIKRNDRFLLIIGAALFLVIVGLSVLVTSIPPLILALYLIASLLTFIIYAADKSAAQKGACVHRKAHFISCRWLAGGRAHSSPSRHFATSRKRHRFASYSG
jgi:cold shock CspA family protein